MGAELTEDIFETMETGIYANHTGEMLSTEQAKHTKAGKRSGGGGWGGGRSGRIQVRVQAIQI